MIRKSPFGSSLIWETLRPGWNCLNSPSSLRQFLCSALIPLVVIIVRLVTGIQTSRSGGKKESSVRRKEGGLIFWDVDFEANGRQF